MSDDGVAKWRARYERQKAARQEAESLLEQKSAALYRTNCELTALAEQLEERVRERANQLQEEESKFHALFQESRDGIIVHDLTGRITDINGSMCRMLGTEEEAVLRLTMRDLLDPSRAGDARSALVEVIRKGSHLYETQMRGEDGVALPVEIAAAIVGMGERVQVHAIVRDVSKRREFEVGIQQSKEALREAKEAAERANQAKSLFLANMSHEIRTPMNGIIGVAELLRTTGLSAEQGDLVDTILMSGEALLEIINDILDLSKIESGKMELETDAFSVFECCERALSTVVAAASKKGLELACVVEDDVPEWLTGDSMRLRQILSNLVGNAVKFTFEGEVLLRVATCRESGGGGRIQFSVRDSGIGIGEEDIAKLFRNFTQIDASTTRHFGGTGLGLAICRKLARLMGGDISVQSEEGEGSEFTVVLPLAAAEPSSGAPRRPTTSFPGARAFVLDDNETSRMAVASSCRRFGLEVVAFGTPHEALAALGSGPTGFHIGFVDFELPEMDGLEFAGRLRDIEGFSELPLVLLSSMGRGPERSADDRWPFEAKLSKPLSPRHLEGVLARALHRSISHAENREVPQEAETRPLRILVAEDNPINLRVACNLLGKMGHSCRTVHDGLEALGVLEEDRRFDVILMDVQMPVLDGVETTRRIRERWPAKDDRPLIVALTADALTGDRERFLAAGMDGYLSKPLRLADIRKTLGELDHALARPLA